MKKNKKLRVVIVGGGFGGVKVALGLANRAGFDVTLISKSTNFEYHGALYRTATGSTPLEVTIPLRDIFHRARNVEVILDSIASIHPSDKAVKSESGHAYEYDVVILGLGNQVNYFGLEGMEEKAYSLSTVPSTIALRHQLISQFKTGKQSTVAVIGGGATGVELSGEIANFAQKVAERYQKKFTPPRVVLIEGSDRVLPSLDPVLSAKAYKQLLKNGVELRLNTRVNSCEIGKVCLKDEDIKADIIVWTAGSKLPAFYDHNAKHFTFDRGRVVVDEHLRAKGHPDIFVIGDNALTPYSGMAQTAIHDAKFVASNLIRSRRHKHMTTYRPRTPIYVVPVGKSWAVVSAGKHQLSGYRAWLIRRRADLWIYKNFEPYGRARKRWWHSRQSAQF